MIELTLLPQHLQSEPGGLIRATVTLHSPNPVPTGFLLEIHGLEESWYTLSLTNLTVSSEEDASAILTLHPPLEAAQGVHPFELLATCPDDPEASARVEAVLLVEEAAPLSMVAPVVAPGGPALLAGLPRRWVVVGAVAAALLLFAGVAYALKSQQQHTNASTNPCATATAGAGCTSTPTPSVAAAQVAGGTITPIASPTGGDLPAPAGTPNPSSGVLPGTATANPATGAVPGTIGTNPGTNTVPGTSISHQRSPAYVLPGSPHSPNHPGQVSQPATATATGSPTVTPAPTDTPTAAPTTTTTATTAATATITPRPSKTATPSATRTPPRTAPTQSTGTSKPTFTPPPTTTSPPTNTPIPSSTASGTVSPTPKASPTPAEIAVRYGYDLTADRFILKWQTANAQAFTVDGQAEPLSGQQTFDLRTHTFVLTATSLDGTQSKIAVVAVYVINSCEVRVNSQPATVPTAACQGVSPTITATTGPSSTGPSSTPLPSGTTAPSSTPVPSDTPIPTATTVYFPTDTAIPTGTNTPIPTATTIPSATPIPTNTFTPVPTATPVPSDTAQPTATATAPFTQTPTLSLTPSRTPTAFPTATGPAPR